MVTIAAHHEGIPLGLLERGGKAKIHIGMAASDLRGRAPLAPVVEVRSLLAYELEAIYE